ncbi:TPA: polysaccharide pyruvyl transferase family protein, partial [Streptococcus suis]
DKLGYKKILLVHYNHSKEALEKFAVAVNKFLETNDDYHVVVVSDSLLNYEEEYYQAFKKKINGESTLFKYSNPDELTKLIDISSLILTCKLHLGVVGCILNKSVIAVACHPEKTLRFYRDIKQSERAISLFDVDSNQIFDLLDKYKDESVQIPKECLEKSKISWKMLDNFLVELNEKK